MVTIDFSTIAAAEPLTTFDARFSVFDSAEDKECLGLPGTGGLLCPTNAPDDENTDTIQPFNSFDPVLDYEVTFVIGGTFAGGGEVGFIGGAVRINASGDCVALICNGNPGTTMFLNRYDDGDFTTTLTPVVLPGSSGTNAPANGTPITIGVRGQRVYVKHSGMLQFYVDASVPLDGVPGIVSFGELTGSGMSSWAVDVGPKGEYNLMETSEPPTIATADTDPITIGFVFVPTNPSDVPLNERFVYCKGIRFYKGSGNTPVSGSRLGRLWTDTNTHEVDFSGLALDGLQLAECEFTDETADGWQEAYFPEPVLLYPSARYIIGVHCPNGNYAYEDNRWPMANGRVIATEHPGSGFSAKNGRFNAGDPIGLPGDTAGFGIFNNYYVDGIFEDAETAVLASDDFNRANESPLAAPWAHLVATDFTTADLTSNAVTPTNPSVTIAGPYYDGGIDWKQGRTTGGHAVSSEGTVLLASGQTLLAAIWDKTDDCGYLLSYNSAGAMALYEIIDSDFTLIGSGIDSAVPIEDGQVVRLEKYNLYNAITILVVYVDGEYLYQAIRAETNSDRVLLDANNPGVYGFHPVTFDNFVGRVVRLPQVAVGGVVGPLVNAQILRSLVNGGLIQ